jgi:hypothetical protein
LEHGLKLDINQLTRRGLIQRGATHGPHALQWTQTATGDCIASGRLTASVEAGESGWVRVEVGQLDQRITLTSQLRRLGGRQLYFKCPTTDRSCSVLWLPPGAKRFGSRHAWRKQVAYASQFESPADRSHRGKAKIKARLIADQDPAAWELPPKPKWMRWSTYLRLEERFDRYEEVLDNHLIGAFARFMYRS